MSIPSSSSSESFRKFDNISFPDLIKNIQHRVDIFENLTEDEKSKQMKWVAEYFQKFSTQHLQEFKDETNWEAFEKVICDLVPLLERENVKASDLIILITRIQKNAQSLVKNAPASIKPITIKANIGGKEHEIIVSKSMIDALNSEIFNTALSGPYKGAISSEIELGEITTKGNFDAIIRTIKGEKNVKKYFDINNMPELMKFANMHELKPLIQQIKDFLKETIQELTDQEDFETLDQIYQEIIQPTKSLIGSESQIAKSLDEVEASYHKAKVKYELKNIEKDDFKITDDNMSHVAAYLNSCIEQIKPNPQLAEKFCKHIAEQIEAQEAGVDHFIVLQSYLGSIPKQFIEVFGNFVRKTIQPLLDPTKDLIFEFSGNDHTALSLGDVSYEGGIKSNLKKCIDNNAFDWFKVVSCQIDDLGARNLPKYLEHIDKIFIELTKASCPNLPNVLKILNRHALIQSYADKYQKKFEEKKKEYPKLANLKIIFYTENATGTAYEK